MLPASNREWFDDVVRSVAGAAHRPSTDDHKVLRAVYAQTRTEACKGYVKGPYDTRSQLDREFGKNNYRVMVRFGIEQGPRARLASERCEPSIMRADPFSTRRRTLTRLSCASRSR